MNVRRLIDRHPAVPRYTLTLPGLVVRLVRDTAAVCALALDDYSDARRHRRSLREARRLSPYVVPTQRSGAAPAIVAAVALVAAAAAAVLVLAGLPERG
jgi:hypothetical protein